MAKIASAREPYRVAAKVGGCVLDAVVDSAAAEYVYLIWARLTDRWELKPDERPEAEMLMRRAAAEWQIAGQDAAARDLHLDHWMFEVCGYSR